MGLGNFLKENGGKIAGSAIGAGLNLLGGALSDRSSRKASEASWQANYDAQKEFAQNSIQWRVQDAKKAGINPYAVIGGQTVGYTPQDISQTQDYALGVSRAGNALGNMLGQLQLASAKEDLKGKKIDNDSKAVDLVNKKIEANMGQVPKTMTKVVDGSMGGKLQTFGSGQQIIRADQSSGIDEPFGFISEVMQRFDRAAHKATAEESNADLGLGLGGYYTIPKWREQTYFEKVGRMAAHDADKYGELGGVLSIPKHLIMHFPRMMQIELARKFFNFLKGGKK